MLTPPNSNTLPSTTNTQYRYKLEIHQDTIAHWSMLLHKYAVNTKGDIIDDDYSDVAWLAEARQDRNKRFRVCINRRSHERRGLNVVDLQNRIQEINEGISEKNNNLVVTSILSLYGAYDADTLANLFTQTNKKELPSPSEIRFTPKDPLQQNPPLPLPSLDECLEPLDKHFADSVTYQIIRSTLAVSSQIPIDNLILDMLKHFTTAITNAAGEDNASTSFDKINSENIHDMRVILVATPNTVQSSERPKTTTARNKFPVLVYDEKTKSYVLVHPQYTKLEHISCANHPKLKEILRDVMPQDIIENKKRSNNDRFGVLDKLRRVLPYITNDIYTQEITQKEADALQKGAQELAPITSLPGMNCRQFILTLCSDKHANIQLPKSLTLFPFVSAALTFWWPFKALPMMPGFIYTFLRNPPNSRKDQKKQIQHNSSAVEQIAAPGNTTDIEHQHVESNTNSNQFFK